MWPKTNKLLYSLQPSTTHLLIGTSSILGRFPYAEKGYPNDPLLT